MTREARVIGVPMDLGQGRRGVDMGPSALRYAGLKERLERLDFHVADLGNLDVPVAEEEESGIPSGLRHLPVVSRVNQELALLCAAAFREGAIPITLGGDHSIAAGSIAGVRSVRRVGVLWVDAHADFNTPATSPSKNLHGMPLAALLGEEPAALAPYPGEERLAAADIVILGLRAVDREERQRLRQRGIKVYTMRDVDEHGVAGITRRALRYFDERDLDAIHLSFDADSLDPGIAAGVGTPVPGGLSYREAHLLMELLHDDGRVCSVDLVEINPILDNMNNTANLCVELLSSLLGETIL